MGSFFLPENVLQSAPLVIPGRGFSKIVNFTDFVENFEKHIEKSPIMWYNSIYLFFALFDEYLTAAPPDAGKPAVQKKEARDLFRAS